ncbi:MAG: PAS domain-containing sensor histidine kinase, partial [Thermoanaerobaculia bacterium]|nr:PAS domain-containing sensor histidine kinase [Thermoanaerobaculia bacterium]
LLFRPGGEVPEVIRGPLERAGTEVLIARSLEEAGTLLNTSLPDVLLIVPPGTAADAAKLLAALPQTVVPPAVFVLSDDAAPRRPLALETIARNPWNRATAALVDGSDDPAAAILLSRVQLTSILELWEQLAAEGRDFVEHALRALSLSLDASRVSLFRWKAGSAVATLVGSSLGSGVVGREVEIARYPELRAAASRSGPVLVEEIDSDPLMGEAKGFLEGAPIRSLLCRQLPGEGSDLYLHAVRERTPFGLVDVALLGAVARLLRAAHDQGRPREPLEKNPDRKRLRTVQRILTGIPDATAMVGPTGEILIVNAPFCALSGRLESELIGLDYHALLRQPVPEDTLDEAPPPDGSPLARERLRLLTGSGQTIPVEVISMPTPDETAGQAGWSTLTLRDRRKESLRAARAKELGKDLAETSRQLETLEASVREAEVMRARFWTAAAHELRTPLAIVQSYLEVVLTDLAAEVPERPTQLLRTASDALSRLERLIADVLDAAVTGRARATLRLADMDLAEVVRGVSGALSAAAFKRGLRLQVDVPKGLPRVSGDREKIERLLTNLVDHSLRSTPRSDEPVLLVASRESDRTVIRIVDKGPTISSERAAHLFDDVGSARSGGEFGLSVARRLADAMKVDLTAYAERDGSNVKRVAWPTASEKGGTSR